MTNLHRTFAGSIPSYYDRYLVPLLFEPYAEDLVRRLKVSMNANVLELACGTGVVTRRLPRTLEKHAGLTATDLSQAMLDIAQSKLQGDERVVWRQADATSLPFEDAAFDVVVCQFGWMFFPDRAQAMREARRVLRSGGQLLSRGIGLATTRCWRQRMRQSARVSRRTSQPSMTCRSACLTPMQTSGLHAKLDSTL
jgi:ubiquinone/menaquinone biosynthesis C-methylase UbiE